MSGFQPLSSQEVHQKMCKKIAQLTKVIFALNTKNEENEGVQKKLKDELLKEQQLLVATATEKLSRLEHQLKQTVARESEISEDFQVAKTQLRSQARSNAEQLETLKRSLNQNFSAEIGNFREKISALTAALEQVKDVANRKIETAQVALNQLKTDKNLEIEQLQLAIDRSEEYRASEAGASVQRLAALTEKIGNLDLRIAAETQISDSLRDERNRLLAAQEISDSKLHTAAAVIDQLKRESEISSRNFQGERSRLETALLAATARAGEMTGQQREAITRMEQEFSDERRDWQKQLDTASEQIDQSRRATQQLSQTHALTLQELETTQKNLQVAISDLQATKRLLADRVSHTSSKDVEIEALRSEIYSLKQEISDQRVTAEAAAQVAAAQAAAAAAAAGEAALAGSRKSHAEEISDLIREHDHRMAELEISRNKKTSEISEAAKTSEAALRAEAAEALAQIRTESEISLREISDQLAAAQKKVARLESEIAGARKFRATQEVERQSLEQLDRQHRAEISDQISAHKAELDRIRSQLVTEHETARKSIIANFENQALQAKNMHTEEISDLQTRHAQALASHGQTAEELRRELAEKLAVIGNFSGERDALQKELAAREGELRELRETHRSEISALSRDFENMMAAVASDEQSRAKTLEIALAEEKRKSELAISDLQGRMESEIAESQTRMQAEIAAAEEKHESEISSLRSSLEAEMSRIKETSETLEKERRAELTTKQAEISENKKTSEAEKRELAGAHAAELEKIRRDAEISRIDQIRKLEEAHKAERERLASEISDSKNLLSSREKEIFGALTSIGNLEKEISDLRDKHADKLSALTALNEKTISDLMKKHEDAQARLKAELTDKLTDVKADFAAERFGLSNQVATLKEKISWLQNFVDARPSKAEDLAEIENLKKQNLEKASALERLGGQMRQFKSDANTREENYGKVFSTQMNVGVVNPLNAPRKPPQPPPQKSRGLY